MKGIFFLETIIGKQTDDDQMETGEKIRKPVQDDGAPEHQRTQDIDEGERIEHVEIGGIEILLEALAKQNDGDGPDNINH